MDQEYIAQTALDQMVGTDQGQLLKALIPYFPPSNNSFCPFLQKPGNFPIQSLFLQSRQKPCRYRLQQPLPSLLKS